MNDSLPAMLFAIVPYRSISRIAQTAGATMSSINEALTVAQVDASQVYRDLSQYKIELSLEEDGWHVDYVLKDSNLKGGGPHYIIDAQSGTILAKRYEQ